MSQMLAPRFMFSMPTPLSFPRPPWRIVAPFPVCVDRAHEVEVLGHRLLRQASGFEGVGRIGIHVHSREPSVADRPHLCKHHVERDPTHAYPPRLMLHHHEPVPAVEDHLKTTRP